MINVARILVPLMALGAGCYLLMVHPQRELRRRALMIAHHLRPGVIVQTASNLRGTILCVTNTSVILELTTGQKIEVLKQTITDVVHEKP